MKNVQTFAGHELKKHDYKTLRGIIFGAVLQEMLSSNGGKYFVTPEQFIVKYNARFGQVNACLDELVTKGLLKPSLDKLLDSGRTQKFYYFNRNAKEMAGYMRAITAKHNGSVIV